MRRGPFLSRQVEAVGFLIRWVHFEGLAKSIQNGFVLVLLVVWNCFSSSVNAAASVLNACCSDAKVASSF